MNVDNKQANKEEQNKIRNIVQTICISLIIDLLGFTVILPLFPSVLEFYKNNDQGSLYTSMEWAVSSFRKFVGVPETEDVNSVLFGGMIGSLFSFLQFLNSPIFGAASDRFGRKPMILISLVGSSLSYLLWAMSKSFSFFIFARIIAGISEANVSISTAAVADLPSAKARSKGMAGIGIAFSIGFVCGPMIGAWFAKQFSHQYNFYCGPAIFGFLITVFDIMYVAKSLPETLPPKNRATSMAVSVKDFGHLLNPISLFRFSAVGSVQNTAKAHSLRLLGVVYFLYLFLFSGLEFTLTFLAHRRFSFTRMDQGKMFALLGLIMALVQGGYIRRKMENSEKQIALKGMFLLIIGLTVVGLSSSVWMLFVGLIFFSCAAASVVPCISSLAATHGDESEKGRVMGILRSLGALARATGPICASVSYWLVGATFTYVVGGLLVIVPWLLLQRLDSICVGDKKKSS
ncbi:unnamed protein product [Clavelina lepadiformis]|uniref:Major facilitator superfamily (MFS) profile domain-containing protein n=1 Tax=Clavelina lepadiformis TaxID=159417 RepID=A0ABP0GFA5_CLALP